MEGKTARYVTLAICPHCGTICEPGHDDDWQAYCSSCDKPYKIEHLKDFTKKEYDDLVANSERIVSKSGVWISYRLKK